MNEQRRLAAIVSADVAGYSRLMGRDESGTLAALKALRQEVVDPAIASLGGRIVKTTGDGLLLEFPSVVNAVRCAVEVQTAMTDRMGSIAEDRRISFRIGINLGDIIVEEDDIFGDGVNVAARLQEVAAPGGICISSRVHDDVRDRLDTVSLPKTSSTGCGLTDRVVLGGWFRCSACCCTYWLRLSNRRHGLRPRLSSCAIS